MHKLTTDDLYTLEAYAKLRPAFRSRVMEHKKHRRLPIGNHVTLLFEDRLTMHYQVQEMLRAERIFEESDIVAELNAYNPLIPDGTNWKATMLIEYPDVEERQVALERLLGVEDTVWLQVDGLERSWCIADEDLGRSTENKTSSVHFLRFELKPDAIGALKNGAGLTAGIAHNAYTDEVIVPELVRESLIADLD